MDHKNDMIKTCCLIVTGYSHSINKERYVHYLKYKLENLILDGYHHFIAYDEPLFDFTVFQVLDIIRKELCCEVNIEYVIVNSNSKRWVTQKREVQYKSVKHFILHDFLTIPILKPVSLLKEL